MKPAPLSYHRPKDLGSAIELVRGNGGFAKYLAGGQTLGPMINLRLTQPDALIDLSEIPELRRVAESPASIRIGAGIRHAEVEDRKIPDPSAGLMPRAARTLAYRAVRNRGTVGGSLAHADPVAEWPTVLTVLDATLHIYGASGERTLGIGDFLIGHLTSALAEEEILTAVTIPVVPRNARIGYRKFCRKTGEFAHSLAAVILDNANRRGRVVLGCAAGKPVLLPTVAQVSLATTAWRDGVEREIRKAVAQDLADLGITLDDYEANLHTTMVLRAVEEVLRQ